MESKIVIFLVFASLAQSCYASTLKVSYGLSENEVVILEKIINNQEVSGIASSDAYETLFDVLIDGLETKTHNHCYKLSEVFAKVKDAVNLFLDSIELLLGDSSSADVEAVRNISCFYLDDVSHQMTSALELAKCGNYSENQADIENSQATVLRDFTDLSEIVWHLISNDPNYQDADVQAVSKSAANESLAGIRHANNAFFNAIKLTAGAVDAECGQYKTLKSYVEELRSKALAGLRYDVENKYSALEALYINSRLNLTGLACYVYEIKYAQTVAQARYAQANNILFNIIKRYATRIRYNLFDDGPVDSLSQDYVDLQRAITIFDVGDRTILDSFLTLDPDLISGMNLAYDAIYTANVEVNQICYGSISAAVAVTSGNYSETVEEIDTLRHQAIDSVPEYTDIWFNIIRNNETFDNATEVGLVYLQNLTIYSAVSTSRYFDGALILVNATYTYEVTDETYSAIETRLAEAIDGIQYFTQGIAAARILVLTEGLG